MFVKLAFGVRRCCKLMIKSLNLNYPTLMPVVLLLYCVHKAHILSTLTFVFNTDIMKKILHLLSV